MFSLAWILGIGLLGPLLALPRRFRIPVAFGEILIGIFFGISGLNLVPNSNQTFALFSNIGFALVMMIAGSHIDFHSMFSSKALRNSVARQLVVAAVATPLSLFIGAITGIHHSALIIVLITSSSAALILPMLTGASDGSLHNRVLVLIAQVSLADLLSILAIPLVLHRGSFSKVIFGSLIVTLVAAIFGALLSLASTKGLTARVRRVSKRLHLGIELRVSLILLLLLAAIANRFSVSEMIAGFSLGLALSMSGVPHRLAEQLFAISEGFFAPFFFVWLGSQIDVRTALKDPHLLALSVLLTIGTWIAHGSTRLFGQKFAFSFISSTQLGVPVAIVAIGQRSGLLTDGQAGAIMLAALFTIIGAAVASLFLEQPSN